MHPPGRNWRRRSAQWMSIYPCCAKIADFHMVGRVRLRHRDVPVFCLGIDLDGGEFVIVFRKHLEVDFFSTDLCCICGEAVPGVNIPIGEKPLRIARNQENTVNPVGFGGAIARDLRKQSWAAAGLLAGGGGGGADSGVASYLWTSSPVLPWMTGSFEIWNDPDFFDAPPPFGVED